MIELNGLQKYYNKDKQNEIHVINDISLNLPESGMCAIFGPSGCGKTTLLNVIGGLDDCESGVISVDGKSLSDHTDIIRNRYIGFIFQNYNLNRDETVFENVADSLYLCGMRDEAEVEKRVMAALANVGMDKFRKRLPDTLSGGQQQRVAIARAIVKNPKIILADEPTGNLDEANTVLVMDILKEMSKDHLVLLVTHEEHLVDYYCNLVIELRDGQIVGTRTNESANGFTVRDKNDIFLGEYNEETYDNGKLDVHYYGEAPEEPLRLTVVNHNGRLLLRIDTPKVSVIDEYSELKLRDGVYTVQEQKERQQKEFDMTDLPEFEGTRYGKLFDFKTSVKRGYQVNFKSMMKQKSKKRLRTTLLMFALVFVFMSAIFGTGLREFLKIDERYNHSIFYVYAENDAMADKMKEAVKNPDSGIDYVTVRYISTAYTPTEENVHFSPSGFDSFGYYETGTSIAETEQVSEQVFFLPAELAEKDPVLVGTKDCVKEGKAIITKAVADKVLEHFGYDYLEDYRDLLGTQLETYHYDYYHGDGFTGYYSEVLRIGCVIDSDENSIYIDQVGHAITAMHCDGTVGAGIDADGYYNLQPGEVIFVKNYYKETEDDNILYVENVKVGDMITVRGKKLRVREILDITRTDTDSSMSQINERIKNGTFEGFADEESRLEYEAYAEKMNAVKSLREQVSAHVPDYKTTPMSVADAFLILGKEDYIECANRAGSTAAALYDEDTFGRVAQQYGFEPIPSTAIMYGSMQLYYAVHAEDPSKAEAYIKEHFGDVATPPSRGDFEAQGVYTPKDIHKLLFTEQRSDIVPFAIILLVIVAFMSVCMYFIMKSMIMNRTKEIGIYRAIGVTKKNVIFRFAVEAGVVVTLSLFLGYLLGSVASFYIQARSTLFYYPVWYALLILAFLYALGIFCGILPVLLVVRKTPSAILAKYDI